MRHDPARTVWHARADALVDALSAVLNWAHEAKGYVSSEADMAEMMSLRGIASVAQECLLPVPHEGEGRFLGLAGIPDALLDPIRRYLGETGGYDMALPPDQQRSDQPCQQHSYVLWSLGETSPEYSA